MEKARKISKHLVVYIILFLLCIMAAVSYLSGIKKKTPASVEQSLTPSERIEHLMTKSVSEVENNTVVGIGQGKDYDAVTEEAINNAGGLTDIVKEGDVVLIKPNLCYRAQPDSPCTTDYRIAGKIAEIVRECGASRIIIAEGNFAGNTFDANNLKLNLYDTIQGVELLNINDCGKEDCYELKHPDSLLESPLYIPKIYIDADVVITVPKLKTHKYANCVATLSLKNQFGIASTKIYGDGSCKMSLHSLFELDKIIVELNRVRKPDFSVVDGIVGGQGYGPTGNSPVESDIVIAGRDLVAVDTVALEFMGIPQEHMTHVILAGEEMLGITDLSKITVVGAELDSIKMKFRNVRSN